MSCQLTSNHLDASMSYLALFHEKSLCKHLGHRLVCDYDWKKNVHLGHCNKNSCQSWLHGDDESFDHRLHHHNNCYDDGSK